MNLEAVKNAVTSKAGRQILIGKKHSPTILFGVGVVGVVATAVLTAKATLKLEEVLDEAEQAHEDARALRHNSHKDRKRDHAYIKARTAIKITKLYAPAVGVGMLSIGALTGSHITLSKRNAGLMAAYSALDRTFNQYQDRVREEVGEEKELEIRRGLESVTIHDTKEGRVIEKQIATGHSQYAKLFDRDTSREWQPQPEMNYIFLRANQNWCNDRLHAKGHLFLNEVYDQLGLSRTSAGAVVGWVRNSKEGDNNVDFGILNPDDELAFHDFMVNHNGAIWLDFNVDGVIYDLI